MNISSSIASSRFENLLVYKLMVIVSSSVKNQLSVKNLEQQKISKVYSFLPDVKYYVVQYPNMGRIFRTSKLHPEPK